MKKIIKFYTNNRKKVLIFLLTLNIIFALFLFRFYKRSNYPEAKWLSTQGMSFEETENYLKKLSNKKSAEYAFGVLREANLPPNTDIHLLAHAIGNILYKQKGVEGIKICTDEFRNACSHTIVIGLFIDKGVEALSDIARACREAPGGSGAYAMCFHGLGHGVLAYTEYDMMTAINLCRKTGSEEFGYIESAECVGGIVMEMVNGVHDKAAWEKQKDNYFRKDDPLYPCNQGFIPSNGRFYCFWYLTPHLWEAAGGEFSNPKDEDFKKAFEYCEFLTGDKEQYKEACYGGFGKEFVVLSSTNADIRKVGEMKPQELEQVYKWCLLAEDSFGIGACIAQAINSMYWGGENPSTTAVLFCNQMDDGQHKEMCFQHLIGSFNFYKKGSQIAKECNTLPSNYRNICMTNINEK